MLMKVRPDGHMCAQLYENHPRSIQPEVSPPGAEAVGGVAGRDANGESGVVVEQEGMGGERGSDGSVAQDSMP